MIEKYEDIWLVFKWFVWSSDQNGGHSRVNRGSGIILSSFTMLYKDCRDTTPPFRVIPYQPINKESSCILVVRVVFFWFSGFKSHLTLFDRLMILQAIYPSTMRPPASFACYAWRGSTATTASKGGHNGSWSNDHAGSKRQGQRSWRIIPGSVSS